MNEVGITAKARQRKRDKRLKTTFSIIGVIILWVGLVGGGYYYALNRIQHISDRINEVMLENQRIGEEIAGTMQLLQQELDSYKGEIQQVQNELQLIQEELELTGESITGTDQTRQSLQERMAELDKQLAALKEQLRKLEEATRAL